MPISIAGSGAVTGASTLNGLTVPTDAIAPGLVHINTTTFNAVSSVSVNGVFSSTYNSYYILLTRTAGSSTTMRMRSAGTDNSASSYELRGYYYGASQGNENITTATSFNISGGSGLAMASIVLTNPFLASNTFGTGLFHAVTIGEAASIVHSVASSFDGLSIIGTSITGNISVYGYRK